MAMFAGHGGAMLPAVVSEYSGSGLIPDGPAWSPQEGALLVVAPHPDDEILAAGGLIRTWAVRGSEVSVLSVSDGEAAEPARHGLGTIRREELTEALRKLCPTHVSVTRLGLPDGRIAHHVNRLRNALLSLARGKLTLIAPYEHDGHPDHEAVGGVCLEFARSQQLPIARYSIWAPQAAEQLREARWGKFPLDDEALRAKTRALGCFRTQLGGRDTGSVLKPYEAFLL
jgi:LmbE family N-acetylglucosaminyl deacetylase